MNSLVFEIDVDDKFASLFTRAGSHIAECNCGKTHIAINSQNFNFDYSETEIQEYIDSANKNKNVILDYEYDCFQLLELGNQMFVYGCDCEGWRPYMNFILSNRFEITDLLIDVSKKVRHLATLHETMDRLKDTID